MKNIALLICFVFTIASSHHASAAFPITRTVAAKSVNEERSVAHLFHKKRSSSNSGWEENKDVIISQLALAVGAIFTLSSLFTASAGLFYLGIAFIFAGYGFAIAGAVNEEERGLRNLLGYTFIFVLAGVYLIAALTYGFF